MFLKKQFSEKFVNSTPYKKRKLTDVSDVKEGRTNVRNVSKFSLFIRCRIYIFITKLFLLNYFKTLSVGPYSTFATRTCTLLMAMEFVPPG